MSEQPNERRIRIVLLDQHLLFRESLARLLSAEPGLELVAQFTTASEALKSLKRSGADVVVVDIGIAREFIPCARKAGLPGKFLAIARDVDATGSAVVLRHGASGIFRDSDSSAWLVKAIRLVANGEAWVDHKVMQLLAERYSPCDNKSLSRLTEREHTVLQGVIDGLSNRRIGARIGVSESTIKSTLRRLFKRAGVRTRSQLVRTALEAPSASGLHAKPEIRAG